MTILHDPSLPLRKAKYERFAQLVASGAPAHNAYEAAGFKRDPANARRLSRRSPVRERIDWLLAQSAEQVIQKTVENTNAAREKLELTRDFVIQRLMQNVRISMGQERVRVIKQLKNKETGEIETVEIDMTMRDASAANRALELLGKELGMFQGDGARDDETEKAPIKTTPRENVIRILERYRDGKTPADLIGKYSPKSPFDKPKGSA